MKIAIDTNRYSDLDRGITEVQSVVANADEVFVPFVVMAELHIGFRRGTRQADNEKKLQRFLAQPGVQILFPDHGTVDLFATLTCQLLSKGTPIPIHDIWIAALCLRHGVTLYARDKHFDHLPQLARV
jgi:tRNA(fMet)-specific endonuclease VapC